MHEKIRGVEGSFKATTKAVELFKRYKHKGKLSIRINTVVSRTNYQTLAKRCLTWPTNSARTGST
jgi:MoaA/NifB/PqqE/SkfB family radical SAM enzyme